VCWRKVAAERPRHLRSPHEHLFAEWNADSSRNESFRRDFEKLQRLRDYREAANRPRRNLPLKLSDSDRSQASSHNSEGLLKRIHRYPDLRTGGLQLAQELRKRGSFQDHVVLAIASGGVPGGYEVSTQLQLPFDIVLIKRLLLPDGPGSELCAISVGGTIILDEGIEVPANPSTPLEHFLDDALCGFRGRQELCRSDLSPLNLVDRKVLLVDCAIRSGSTMKVAIRAIRKLNAARITAAIPVASREGHLLVESLADEMVCLAQPEPFGNAGVWYEDFSRPEDKDMHELLDPI
jgi:putative phosphoribosyl transferase